MVGFFAGGARRPRREGVSIPSRQPQCSGDADMQLCFPATTAISCTYSCARKPRGGSRIIVAHRRRRQSSEGHFPATTISSISFRRRRDEDWILWVQPASPTVQGVGEEIELREVQVPVVNEKLAKRGLRGIHQLIEAIIEDQYFVGATSSLFRFAARRLLSFPA